jgi:hypothetical protein
VAETPRLEVVEVKFYTDEERADRGGQDGCVRYRIPNYPFLTGPNIEDVVYHPWEISQAFHRGPFALLTDRSGLKWQTWEWDGDREAPTLSPSFLCERPAHTIPFRLHLYFRKGKVELLGDSTVVLA